MPSRSLFARTFSPVPTYIFDKGFPILSFFSSLSFIIGIFFVYLHTQSERSAVKILCLWAFCECQNFRTLLLIGFLERWETLVILLSMRLLFPTAKLLLFPQKAHKHITEIFTIFTESAARLRAVRRNQLILHLRIPWASKSPFVIQSG